VSLLRALAGAATQARSWEAFLDPNRIPSNGELMGYSAAGEPINERSAMRMLTVHACVRVITDTVAQLPVGRFRGVGPARERLPDHPLLTEPEIGKEWNEWIGEGMVSDLLRGNAYSRIVDRDGLGRARGTITLHPDECKPYRDRETGAVRYRVSGEREPLDPSEIIHVKGLTPAGRYSLEGLSPIEYAAQTIGLALGAERFGAQFFGDGGHPSGILTSDQVLDPATALEAKRRWMAAQGRNREPAVMGKNLKWQTVSIPPNESQFLETIDAKAGTICGFFGVPPHLISIVSKSTSWGTGIEEQVLGFITFAIGMWLVRWEARVSREFAPGEYMKFNVAGLLRGRLLDRYRAYLMGRQGGWLNIDDVRAKEDEPPLPEGKGEDYLTPLNYGPIPPGGLVIDPTKEPGEDEGPPIAGDEDDEEE